MLPVAAEAGISHDRAMNIEKAGQHLDHMVRTTRLHHVHLSTMADMKANMLLTMSAVVITLSAPHIFKPEFRWPLIVLTVFCLLTIALATYAVMPKFRGSSQLAPDPDGDARFNLLFFGDFIRLDYPKFHDAMEAVMNDHNRVYEAQVREIYLLGTFLARKKYRFLWLAYVSFLAGLLASFALTLVSVALG